VVVSVEPSPELEVLVRRRHAAWNERDLDTVFNLYSDDPGLLIIGTDPGEWASGLSTVRAIGEAQNPEHEEAGSTIELDHVEAYCEGTVGWVAFRATARSKNAEPAELRYTAVAHLERGVWRFVQGHLSQGVDGEVTFGRKFTTTVEQLAAAARVEQLDLSETTADDGTVTIAFSDIERSTDLAVRLGDERWFELLRWHNQVVSKCVVEHGGRIVKSLGDGYMIAFASARRALNSAIEIQRSLQEAPEGENLCVRIGLHTGEVVRDAEDFFGHAVIMAARVAAAARGNEILVSSLVNELTRDIGVFEFGEPRSMQLKGFPGERQLFPVIWN
jgi:class 3 adenylate cyclase